MAIPQHLIERIRRLVGDIGATETYVDTVLEGFTLDGVATINALIPSGFSANEVTLTISPAPGYNDPFGVLFTLQGAIDLLNGQWGNNSRKALSVRSGSVSLNTSVGLAGSKNNIDTLIKRRDDLIAKMKAEGLGSGGDVYDADQIIEDVPNFADAQSDNDRDSHIIVF